nr:hypothetical protein [Propionicimonas sp.]
MTGKDRIGATDLGIDLSGPTDGQLFKWLVACLLFGTRISQEIAAAAFRALDDDGVLTPRKLADADWQHLVDLLGKGHYRRYDESKARELITLGNDVLERYDGKLSRLPKDADSTAEIKRRLGEFTGIGPTATRIFLRDVGDAWVPTSSRT